MNVEELWEDFLKRKAAFDEVCEWLTEASDDLMRAKFALEELRNQLWDDNVINGSNEDARKRQWYAHTKTEDRRVKELEQKVGRLKGLYKSESAMIEASSHMVEYATKKYSFDKRYDR